MPTSQHNSDEIDLLHLLANLTRFLVKNWLVIVLSMGSCIAISWIYYLQAPRVYASDMMVQSKFLTESYAAQVVKALQEEIAEENFTAVAPKLNLTEAEAALLKRISVNSPFTEKINMLEEDKIIFQFSVETLDPAVLPKLQSGLTYFFENLEYVKLRVAQKKKSHQNLISRIDHEINRLDSLPRDAESGSLYPPPVQEKKMTRQKNMQNNEMQNSILFDPSAMSVFMTKERNDAREKLAMTLNGIEIIQGFEPFRRPVRPRLLICLATGFSSGVLLSLLLLGISSVQGLFKKYPV